MRPTLGARTTPSASQGNGITQSWLDPRGRDDCAPKRPSLALLDKVLPGHGLEAGSMRHLFPPTIAKDQRSDTG